MGGYIGVGVYIIHTHGIVDIDPYVYAYIILQLLSQFFKKLIEIHFLNHRFSYVRTTYIHAFSCLDLES